jgi:predicted phosphate transport protein (TIGR00153 family)
MAYIGVFRNKVGIEKEIDDFLDLVSESGLIFAQGMDFYLRANLDSFGGLLEQIINTERSADHLRRSIEELLYRRTLIPESRGDVLRMIENMDSLLGKFKGAMWRLQIEQPDINEIFIEDFNSLINYAVKSVESTTLSVRAYFKDINAVADHMHKVSFWETEADKIATQLQTKIFKCEELSLSKRMQLRDLVLHIEDISNQAEDVADSLAIYVIKRSL